MKNKPVYEDPVIEKSRIKYFKNKKIKYIIEFVDVGQDTSKLHINKDGIVIKTETCGFDWFTGKITIPDFVKVGDRLPIWLDGEAYIDYPIKSIKVFK